MFDHDNRHHGHWPDKTDLLVHLTKNEHLGNREYPDTNGINIMNAKQRLISIINQRRILASRLRHFNVPGREAPSACCFTEAIPDTVRRLANIYSPYGIIVHKRRVFEVKGSPAYYIRNEYFKAITGDTIHTNIPALQYPEDLLFLLQPFVPGYAPLDPNIRFNRDTYHHWYEGMNDWSQEREWRTPDDFVLPYEEDIPAFSVLVPDAEARDTIITSCPDAFLREPDFILPGDIPQHP